METTQSHLESFIPATIAHLHREYPNGISHRLFSDDDIVAKPSQLYPAFYGCYDWHSAVHSHWQVARAVRLFPDAAFVGEGIETLNQHLTVANIATELDYISRRATFEMPYGMAWLLQLTAELREWGSRDAERWLTALAPMEEHAVSQFQAYLDKMKSPVRTGTHNQTAFSLGLLFDWAVAVDNRPLQLQIRSQALHYYGDDVAAPLAYEPSGTDFLSPTLAEADLMRRVLDQDELVDWLNQFLGEAGQREISTYLQPVGVGDFSDGQLAHFAGLNMSRAWMFGKIAAALPPDLPFAATLARLAQQHRDAGLGNALHGDYMVSHWAPTFVVYLLTER